MLTTVDDIDRDALRLAIMRLSRRIRAERARDDVTDGQLSVLFFLLHEGPQTLGQLAEQERVSPPSANRTVNQLVEAGLAARSDSPDDGRKVIIALTEDGTAIARETKRRRAAWLDSKLAALRPEQRRLIEAATPALRELADS